MSECISGLDTPSCRLVVLKFSNYLNQLHTLTGAKINLGALNSMEIREQGKALCFVSLLCLWTCVSGSLSPKGVNFEGD